MSRLIWVPQFPTAMRYQEWFYREFKEAFEKEYDEVIILGKEWIHKAKIASVEDKEMFSPIGLAIELEFHQMQEYLALDLQDGDTLFHCDLSFPGLFHNMLYHKRPDRAYVYCHGTALNNMDYYERNRTSKWSVEWGNGIMYDRVFVATNYHQNKLYNEGELDNTNVIALPDFKGAINWKLPKVIEIASACRPTPQKVNIDLENEIEEAFNVKIQRADFNDWESYFKFLASSKMLLLTTSEETFGYTVLDAVRNNCIPIAPNKYSYPELLPRQYLYDDDSELFILVKKCLNGELEVPELLNQTMINDFYKNLIYWMKK